MRVGMGLKAFGLSVAMATWSTGGVAQPDTQPPPHQDPRAGYAALAQLPDWSGVWSPDWSMTAKNRSKEPQFTQAAAQTSQAFKAAQERGENLQGEVANCLPPGMPGIMSQPYPIEFLFRPGAVYLITETYSQVRRIYTDGRSLPEDPDPFFNGHSVGRWENDTLVVETTGINPRNVIVPGIHATEQTRIRETFRSDVPGKLTVETSITDPTLFVEPFVTRASFARNDSWEMREYVCAENNKDGADEFGRPTMNLD